MGVVAGPLEGLLVDAGVAEWHCCCVGWRREDDGGEVVVVVVGEGGFCRDVCRRV